MGTATYDLIIAQGKTLQLVIGYHDAHTVQRQITGMPSSSPVRLTVPGHGVPDNWAVRIERARSPAGINTPAGEYQSPIVIDANTLEFDQLNLAGAKGFSAPAVLSFPAPADLAGWEARMQIRSRIGGDLLLSFSSMPGDKADGRIEVDVTNSAFIVTLDAEKTAAIEWASAVYDLEGIRPDGVVVEVISPSRISVAREVTKWA